MTYPERIRAWVAREFNARYVERVTADLIDVAAGNRPGNAFELQALAKILGARCPACGNGSNLETDEDVADYSCEACEITFDVQDVVWTKEERVTPEPYYDHAAGDWVCDRCHLVTDHCRCNEGSADAN